MFDLQWPNTHCVDYGEVVSALGRLLYAIQVTNLKNRCVCQPLVSGRSGSSVEFFAMVKGSAVMFNQVKHLLP